MLSLPLAPRLDRSPRERRTIIRFGFECVQQFGYSPQFIELLANICAALGKKAIANLPSSPVLGVGETHTVR